MSTSSSRAMVRIRAICVRALAFLSQGSMGSLNRFAVDTRHSNARLRSAAIRASLPSGGTNRFSKANPANCAMTVSPRCMIFDTLRQLPWRSVPASRDRRIAAARTRERWWRWQSASTRSSGPNRRAHNSRATRRAPFSTHRTSVQRCDSNTRRIGSLGPCPQGLAQLPWAPCPSPPPPMSEPGGAVIRVHPAHGGRGSRMSQPAVLAQICRRIQEMAGFSGSNSLALAASSRAAELCEARLRAAAVASERASPRPISTFAAAARHV